MHIYRWTRDGAHEEESFSSLDEALARVDEHIRGSGLESVRALEITDGPTTVRTSSQLRGRAQILGWERSRGPTIHLFQTLSDKVVEYQCADERPDPELFIRLTVNGHVFSLAISVHEGEGSMGWDALVDAGHADVARELAARLGLTTS